MAKRRTRATVGSGLAAEDVFDLPPLRRGEAVAFATPRGTAGQVPGAGDVTNLVQPERFRPPSAATAPPGLARLPQSQLTKLGAVGASQQTAENKRNRERAASAQDRLRRQKADLAGGTIEAKIRRERAKGEPARKAAEQEAAAGVAKEERESKERIANVPVDVEQERTKRAAAETKAKSGDLATRIEGEQELANIKIKGDLAQTKAEGKTFEQQIDIIGEQSKARIAEADAKGNVEQRNAAVKAELGAYGDAMAEAVAAGNTTAAITIAEKMRTRANEFAGKTEATPAPEGTAGGAAAGTTAQEGAAAPVASETFTNPTPVEMNLFDVNKDGVLTQSEIDRRVGNAQKLMAEIEKMPADTQEQIDAKEAAKNRPSFIRAQERINVFTARTRKQEEKVQGGV